MPPIVSSTPDPESRVEGKLFACLNALSALPEISNLIKQIWKREYFIHPHSTKRWKTWNFLLAHTIDTAWGACQPLLALSHLTPLNKLFLPWKIHSGFRASEMSEHISRDTEWATIFTNTHGKSRENKLFFASSSLSLEHVGYDDEGGGSEKIKNYHHSSKTLYFEGFPTHKIYFTCDMFNAYFRSDWALMSKLRRLEVGGVRESSTNDDFWCGCCCSFPSWRFREKLENISRRNKHDIKMLLKTHSCVCSHIWVGW